MEQNTPAPFETPPQDRAPSFFKKYGLLLIGALVVFVFSVLTFFFFTYTPS